MQECSHIPPPTGEDDTEGAQRVFEEFLLLYEPALACIECYLGAVIEEMEPLYAEAYIPWHRSLQDLFRGVYFLSKRIPLPDPQEFAEALRVFSFDSAIQFLNDLCINCRLPLPYDWAQRFREHIDLLLFSLSIMHRRDVSLAR